MTISMQEAQAAVFAAGDAIRAADKAVQLASAEIRRNDTPENRDRWVTAMEAKEVAHRASVEAEHALDAVIAATPQSDRREIGSVDDCD